MQPAGPAAGAMIQLSTKKPSIARRLFLLCPVKFHLFFFHVKTSFSGTVAANYGKEVEVLSENGDLCTCELASNLGDTPVAGDRVEYVLEGEKRYLTSVAPRRHVIRRAGKREGDARILAAHVDQGLVVSAVKPRLKEGLVDRYIVALLHEGIEPVIVLNKSDLDEGDMWQRMLVYKELGYETFRTSAVKEHGIEALRRHLHGKNSVLVGHSGVGKSTLLMALLPDTEIDTSDVSGYSGKGVHTTTTARMYAGPDGMRIVDSPGIRAFGLSGIDRKEIRDYFVEFEEHQSQCRFRDCMHLNDDGCAVRAALDRGEIGKLRYESYVRMVESV
jgi:ribosome biogenesis GTPase